MNLLTKIALRHSRARLSIVIPILNEEQNIRNLAKEINSAFDRAFNKEHLFIHYEVIWVDDGSSDKTAKVLSDINEEFPHQKYIILMRTIGQSGALMAGIDKALGKYIATMDGDGQDNPADLIKMYEILEEKMLDLVVGWRKNRWKKNIFRRIPSIMANIIIRLAFKAEGIHDAGCAVKVGRKEIFKEIKLYGELHRFITYIAIDLGARIQELPIENRSRKHGKSKYTLMRTFTVIMDIINLKFIMMKKTTPIQVVGPIAMVMFLISFITFAITIILRFVNNFDITGNPLFLISIIMFLTATQFIFYGLLGELIIRTYYENGVTKRYMVRDISHTLKK